MLEANLIIKLFSVFISVILIIYFLKFFLSVVSGLWRFYGIFLIRIYIYFKRIIFDLLKLNKWFIFYFFLLVLFFLFSIVTKKPSKKKIKIEDQFVKPDFINEDSWLIYWIPELKKELKKKKKNKTIVPIIPNQFISVKDREEYRNLLKEKKLEMALLTKYEKVTEEDIPIQEWDDLHDFIYFKKIQIIKKASIKLNEYNTKHTINLIKEGDIFDAIPKETLKNKDKQLINLYAYKKSYEEVIKTQKIKNAKFLYLLEKEELDFIKFIEFKKKQILTLTKEALLKHRREEFTPTRRYMQNKCEKLRNFLAYIKWTEEDIQNLRKEFPNKIDHIERELFDFREYMASKKYKLIQDTYNLIMKRYKFNKKWYDIMKETPLMEQKLKEFAKIRNFQTRELSEQENIQIKELIEFKERQLWLVNTRGLNWHLNSYQYDNLKYYVDTFQRTKVMQINRLIKKDPIYAHLLKKELNCFREFLKVINLEILEIRQFREKKLAELLLKKRFVEKQLDTLKDFVYVDKALKYRKWYKEKYPFELTPFQQKNREVFYANKGLKTTDMLVNDPYLLPVYFGPVRKKIVRPWKYRNDPYWEFLIDFIKPRLSEDDKSDPNDPWSFSKNFKSKIRRDVYEMASKAESLWKSKDKEYIPYPKEDEEWGSYDLPFDETKIYPAELPEEHRPRDDDHYSDELGIITPNPNLFYDRFKSKQLADARQLIDRYDDSNLEVDFQPEEEDEDSVVTWYRRQQKENKIHLQFVDKASQKIQELIKTDEIKKQASISFYNLSKINLQKLKKKNLNEFLNVELEQIKDLKKKINNKNINEEDRLDLLYNLKEIEKIKKEKTKQFNYIQINNLNLNSKIPPIMQIDNLFMRIKIKKKKYFSRGKELIKYFKKYNKTKKLTELDHINIMKQKAKERHYESDKLDFSVLLSPFLYDDTTTIAEHILFKHTVLELNDINNGINIFNETKENLDPEIMNNFNNPTNVDMNKYDYDGKFISETYDPVNNIYDQLFDIWYNKLPFNWYSDETNIRNIYNSRKIKVSLHPNEMIFKCNLCNNMILGIYTKLGRGSSVFTKKCFTCDKKYLCIDYPIKTKEYYKAPIRKKWETWKQALSKPNIKTRIKVNYRFYHVIHEIKHLDELINNDFNYEELKSNIYIWRNYLLKFRISMENGLIMFNACPVDERVLKYNVVSFLAFNHIIVCGYYHGLKKVKFYHYDKTWQELTRIW